MTTRQAYLERRRTEKFLAAEKVVTALQTIHKHDCDETIHPVCWEILWSRLEAYEKEFPK